MQLQDNAAAEIISKEDEISKFLAGHPYFVNFKPEYLEFFEGCAEEVSFERGQYLYRENTEADRMYLVIEGRTSIELVAPGQDPWSVMTVCKGGVLGWSWAFPPYVWYFSCKATMPTRTIRMDARCLRSKMQTDVEFGYMLMNCSAHVLEERLRGTRLQLLNQLIRS